jgi:exodeoxyribonuclease VII large subunit
MELFDTQLSPEATIRRLEVGRDRMESICSRIQVNINNMLSKQRLEFKGIESLLESVNPENVLQRGYSLVTDADGNVMTSVDSISEGMDITVRMRDGKVGATVNNKVRSDE